MPFKRFLLQCLIGMITIILDTSIFVNPQSRCVFGTTAYEAFTRFLAAAKLNAKICCLMPPSIYEELSKFLEGPPLTPHQTGCIEKRPPARYQDSVPALFVYELIEETRVRVNKGLRITEKYIRKSAAGAKEDELIKTARDEYRMALREGIIDSRQDCDLLLLAKETSGRLATSDEGLVTWAAKLGITSICAQELHELVSLPANT